MAKKKQSIKFGFLFWIAFICIVLLLFFINKDNIRHVLETVHIHATSKNNIENPQAQIQKEIERINEKTDIGETVNTAEKKTKDTPEMSDIPEEKAEGKNTEHAQREKSAPQESDGQNTDNTQTAREQKNNKTEPTNKKNANNEAVAEKQTTQTSEAKTSRATIYFVRIDADGHISRVACERRLNVSDSPMSDALKSLFAGTSKAENEKSYRSLIPPETKLLAASVRDGVAYINVSENFEFNKYGIEGYLAELAQVVYTATEFSTVKSVQFLIEGRKKDYLGSDGVWIGSPLSRDSF